MVPCNPAISIVELMADGMSIMATEIVRFAMRLSAVELHAKDKEEDEEMLKLRDMTLGGRAMDLAIAGKLGKFSRMPPTTTNTSVHIKVC